MQVATKSPVPTKYQHLSKEKLLALSELFLGAVDTGLFEYNEKATYWDWICFLNKHSPKIKIQFGKRDPEFVEELKRLGNLAKQLAGET